VLLLLLSAWDRGSVVWRPPSTAFLDHDVDGDLVVSREEWESRYGTSAATPEVLAFEHGDCDRDGRLTWQEFHGVVRWRTKCATSALEVLQRQAGTGADAEAAVEILNDKDLQLARVSLSRNRRRLVAAKFHEGYAEQDWPAGTMYQHSLDCGEAEEVDVPATSQDFRRLSRLAALEEGSRTGLRCSLRNRGQLTLTWVALRISTKGNGQQAVEWHGKAVWVPPRASREFWVFADSSRIVVSVSVIAVRSAHE